MCTSGTRALLQFAIQLLHVGTSAFDVRTYTARLPDVFAVPLQPSENKAFSDHEPLLYVCVVRLYMCAVRLYVCAVRLYVCVVRLYVCVVRLYVCAVRLCVCAVRLYVNKEHLYL